jgi:thiol-disulfide isomerase/thioredoxin
MSRTLGIINMGLIATLLVSAITMVFAAGSYADDLQGYTPVYSLGSGKEDWWIRYPDQSPKAGSAISHLPWIIDALKERPVIVLGHSTDCASCKIQKKDLEKVLDIYSNDVTYYDINTDLSEKTNDVMYTYYPNSGIPKVPTTVVFTLIKDSDGKVAVGWHSMDDAMGEEIITAYVKDAIFYYRQNFADWTK